MTSTKVIVLDFDNCIVLDESTREGSEEVKYRAWFDVFPEYERSALKPVLEKANRDIAGGKGDRKDVAERILTHFGYEHSPIPEEAVCRCDRFNALVQEGIKKIGLSQKTKDALAALSSRLPLYVNTATPREAALESLEALGIAAVFKDIYGRPGTKVGNLRDIVAAESVNPSELLFVDDQPSGWQAAQEVGCRFVGIHTAQNTLWHNTIKPFPIIYSLAELAGMI